MNEIDTIKMEAISLGVDESTSIPCVFCGTKYNKLSITRTDEGIIYNCYRASCTAKGFIGSYGSWISPSKAASFVPKKFTQPTRELGIETTLLMEEKYHICISTLDHNNIKEIETTGVTLVMPMYTMAGTRFGVTTKVLRGLSSSKAMHYKEQNFPMLHAPKAMATEQYASVSVVLVEDILSAIRINKLYTNWRGVALLGTSFGDDKVKTLMEMGTKNIIVALDPDAVKKSGQYVREKSFFFKTFKAAVMSADPKDLPDDKLREELGI